MDEQMTIKTPRSSIGKYLSIQKVAELLCCSERHIYGLIQDGKLTAIRLGSRAFRISEQSVVEFIEAQTVDPEDFFAPEEDAKEIPKEMPVARSKWMKEY